jgi:DNA-binding IscR family transcriptional regulator
MKTDIQEQVLNLIPKKREDAITSKELMSFTGLSFRHLKKIISELRIIYPICSRETDGGGYWLAEDERDIKEFISMISRRRDGYNKTIAIMENHINDEVN